MYRAGGYPIICVAYKMFVMCLWSSDRSLCICEQAHACDLSTHIKGNVIIRTEFNASLCGMCILRARAISFLELLRLR